MTQETQAIVKAAKHAGIDGLIYLGICILFAFGAVAVDTHFFTKPLSWFQARQVTLSDK